jgi:hypothetical protein
MNKQDLKNKEALKRHAISLEKNPNRKAKLQNDLNILHLRIQIEDFKEKIERLRNN